MSEYIEFESESAEDGTIIIQTNLPLTSEDDEEIYGSTAELEEGSPVAQALSVVDGIESLQMRGSEIVVTCLPDTDRHVVIADMAAALREFFL